MEQTLWVYKHLSENEKNYLQSKLNAIELPKNVSDTAQSQMAYLSILPDKRRKQKLKQLFAAFNQAVPAMLENFQDQNTSKWHYHNQAIGKKSCSFKNRGQLMIVLPVLQNVLLNETLNPTQELIILGFALHLLQDFHQPFHLKTKLDRHCRSDLGGNLTCIAYDNDAKCMMNLHLLWDIGFGVFDELSDITLDKNLLAKIEFSPSKWIEAETSQGLYQFQLPTYESMGRTRVESNVNIGLHRQLYFLKQHISNHE